MNIGPNYWKGEEGRLALIAGRAKFTDPQFVAPFRNWRSGSPISPMDFEAETVTDSQNMFTLGRAAIYPAGSWEISGFKLTPTSRWARSRPRSPRTAINATSPITRITASAWTQVQTSRRS